MSMYGACSYCGESVVEPGTTACSDPKHRELAKRGAQIAFFSQPAKKSAVLLAREAGLPEDYFLRQIEAGYCLMITEKQSRGREDIETTPGHPAFPDPPLDEQKAYPIAEKNDRKASKKAQAILNSLKSHNIESVELLKLIDHFGYSEWKKISFEGVLT